MECDASETGTREARFVPHGPGAAVEATFSYVTTAKRQVTLYTLCPFCSHGLSEEEQRDLILHLAGEAGVDPRLWKHKEWVQYLTLNECEEILNGKGEVQLHVSCFVSLSY